MSTSNPSIVINRQKRGVRSNQNPKSTSSKSSSEKRSRPAIKEDKKMKILVADDNSINVLILSRMLEILPTLTDG